MLEKLRPYVPWLLAALVLWVIVRARSASTAAAPAVQPADQSGTDTAAQISTLSGQVAHLGQSLSDLYNLSQSGALHTNPSCPSGMHVDATGNCVLNAPCSPNAYWNGSYCACDPGYVADASGATCSPSSPTGCGTGYHFDSTLHYCVPDAGHY